MGIVIVSPRLYLFSLQLLSEIESETFAAH